MALQKFLQVVRGSPTALLHKRHFWHWINFVFNRVDHSRVREVGPDRAAAEWMLRLGGSVKFCDFDHWSNDYNRLPSQPKGRLKIEAIDASSIAITDNGLEHLAGLECLQRLKMSGCKYIGDTGLVHLTLVKDSLRELDISQCSGITGAGLPSLYVLRCLKKLDIRDTPAIRKREAALSQLQEVLPKCQILS